MIWTLKVVSSNFNYSSCDSLKDVLKAVFPDNIPEGFTMSSLKISYVITDATGPYFQNIITEDVKNSNVEFILMYDETTNTQNLKQLQVKVR